MAHKQSNATKYQPWPPDTGKLWQVYGEMLGALMKCVSHSKSKITIVQDSIRAQIKGEGQCGDGK